MESRLYIFEGEGLKHYRLVHESQANPYALGGNEEQRCKALCNMLYSFEMPYSTLGPIPGETIFDTRPTGPCTITAGDVSKTVDVAEQDVLDGGTVTVNIE